MEYGKQDKPVFSREDKRGGFHELVNSGEWQSLAAGRMHAGAQMGHHYHRHTTVYFHLLSGRAMVKTLNIKNQQVARAELRGGQGYLFRPEEVRVITYTEESEFLLMKSHRYEADHPDLIDYPEDF